MTLYKAAALLNACLDRITEVTDELRRLIKEFETELAVLRGRVDGLEARVGELSQLSFRQRQSSLVAHPGSSVSRRQKEVSHLKETSITANSVACASVMTWRLL